MDNLKTVFDIKSSEQKELDAYTFLERGEYHDVKKLSYSELQDKVYRLGQYFINHFKPGTKMVLIFEPGLDFIIAFWACMVAGMVAVPVYPPADKRTRSRFLGICKDAEAQAVLTTSPILKKSKIIKLFIRSLRKMKWLAVDQIYQSTPYSDIFPKVNSLAPALFQYTSGSTSEPKGVILSQANILSNTQCLNAPLKTSSRQESFACWLPFYHDMGLMSGIVMPLFLGSSSTLLSPLHFLQKPVRWLQAISRSQASISAAPNFAYEICLKKVTQEHLKTLDLSSWRVALNGAEAIRSDTLERFESFFKPTGFSAQAFYPSYGLAESTVFVTGGAVEAEPVTQTFSRSDLQLHRIKPSVDTSDAVKMVGVGYPWENHQLKIVSPETGQECHDTVGEIWVQGPSIGQGYWQKQDLTEKMFQAKIKGQEELGCFLRTGDLGFIYQGELFISGRLKEMLIVNGQNYFPQNIECLAESCHSAFRPGCSAAFSIGQPEKAILVMEVRKNQAITQDGLTQAVRQGVSQELDIPLKEILFILQGTLPKTSSGKIQRRKTKELYEQKKLKYWKPKQ